MKHHRRRFTSPFTLGMNPVIRFLTMSDVVILGASQLLAPVFPIFVINDIQGGNVAVAGVAAAVYMVAKSVTQVPVASLMDRIKGEYDDFYLMFWGSIASSLVFLGYLFIETPFHLYIVQLILGITSAVTFPPYMAIFTRHVDKTKENMEWGFRFTLTDISSALGASLGGFLALTYGFHILILFTVIISILGVFLLWPIRFYLKKR